MHTKQSIIIRYYRQGQSQRQISRELGLNRKTVRRYIESYERTRSSSNTTASTSEEVKELEALNANLQEAPQYDTSKRSKRKLTKELCAQIDVYLAQNRVKRSSGKSKQVMKKIDVWEALVVLGFSISYPSVCNYIRSQESQKEAFIRQVYKPGSVCEFDWGEVKLIIDGVEHKLQLAVFTLAWSNYRYAYLYNRQHTQSFHQSHVRFFEHIAGIPVQMVYDNMRVVIKRFVGRTEKEATKGLLSLSMYYQFAFRFCNVRKGNEKGHVERSVEYIRRKAFCIREEFVDLAAANAHLLKIVRGLNEKEQVQKGASALAQLQQARPYLGPCPAVPMECAELRSLRVDKYSTICMAQNHYSVPEQLVGKMVEVKIYAEHLLVYYNKQALCRHQRHHSRFGWHLDLAHYLSTLQRKPGALKGSQALEQASITLRGIYHKYFQEQPRQFIDLLHYQRAEQVSVLQLQQIIGDLLQLGCKEISLDKIKMRLEHAPLREQAPKEGDIAMLAKQQLREVAGLFHQN